MTGYGSMNKTTLERQVDQFCELDYESLSGDPGFNRRYSLTDF